MAINRNKIINKNRLVPLAMGYLLIYGQTVIFASADDLKYIAPMTASSYNSENTIAPNTDVDKPNSSWKNKTMILHGKAEVTEQVNNNLQAWQASQVYREGVKALSAKEYNIAAQFFKIAGDGFAAAGNNEKFLAESRYAEGQSTQITWAKTSRHSFIPRSDCFI